MKEINQMQPGELERYRRYLEKAFDAAEPKRRFRLPECSATFALLTLFALFAVGFSAFCIRPAQARKFQKMQQKSLAMEKNR